MFRLTAAIFFLSVATVIAFPTNNEQLDKATINDVAVNTVSEEKKVEQTVVSSDPQQPAAPASSIQITGITTGLNPSPAAPATENTPFKPVRTGSVFARFIDDIFQIPIAVLQNVAKLISNPFNQRKNPEVVATVS
ncbi:uncharacterized protein LOC130441325 [Diorhabda sublineata]|uniref:uncharacterized protein LOC130441325 n=1 Tax=Diorhabda sublineata TaxID=1163346 RepID=UPI0024E148E5|nr:uncharacterized protein LOC130441325 [Diorhabda sublineata]